MNKMKMQVSELKMGKSKMKKGMNKTKMQVSELKMKQSKMK